MERANHQRLIERLTEQMVERTTERMTERTPDHLRVEQPGTPEPAPVARPAFRVAADRYRSAVDYERERDQLFGAPRGGTWVGPPRVIAGSASIAAGACVPVDVPGASLIVTRGEDGVVRGLSNACRHRATRLVDEPCSPKALVCPYHGWTYDLRGSLIHVPHAETFAATDRRNLVALPVTERHGVVWLGTDVAGYLGALDGDPARPRRGHDRRPRFRRARSRGPLVPCHDRRQASSGWPRTDPISRVDRGLPLDNLPERRTGRELVGIYGRRLPGRSRSRDPNIATPVPS